MFRAVREWKAVDRRGRGPRPPPRTGRFPPAAAERFRLLGEGWDKTLWLRGRRWVFLSEAPDRRAGRRAGARRPARDRAAPAFPHPAPAVRGDPVGRVPAAVPRRRAAPGDELADAGLGDAAARRCAPSRRVPAGAAQPRREPVPGARRAAGRPGAGRHGTVPRMRARLAEPRGRRLWERHRRSSGPWPRRSGCLSRCDVARARGPPRARPARGPARRATAVIDWTTSAAPIRPSPGRSSGARCAAGRDAFLDAYGPVVGERLLRARVLGASLRQSRTRAREGMPALERESLRGFDLAVAD